MSSSILGRNLLLSDLAAARFLWVNMLAPSATLTEIQAFMREVAHTEMSLSSIVDYNKRFGFSSKRMQYYSTKRDENDRVAFWVNGLHHPIRPGVFQVPHTSFVDIDEMGIYETAASRICGCSFVGIPARLGGRPRHHGEQWTILAAVDARVSVVARLVFHGGTSTDIFEFFLRYVFSPKIAETGPCVFTYDNLSAHLAPSVRDAIHYEGHSLVLRPIHSPDFGGVEWVFSYVNQFLKHNDRVINQANLESAIHSALDIVTPTLVAKFMAAAHFFVPGCPFKPYNGEQ